MLTYNENARGCHAFCETPASFFVSKPYCFLARFTVLLEEAPSGGGEQGGHENAGAARQQQPSLKRLQAIVSILSIWESETLQDAEIPPNNADAALPLPAVERVHRLRTEASVKALVDPTGVHSPTRSIGVSVIHDASAATVHRPGVGTREEDVGAAATAARGGSIVALMQEWWPKLISAAVDTREWAFLCL